MQKRLGQLNNGPTPLIRNAYQGEDGQWRIKAKINTLGTATPRCTHSVVANIPKASAQVPYGAEFRDLFEAHNGWVLVGSDADTLELRLLAHYLHEYDGGEYAKVVDEGKKFEGDVDIRDNLESLIARSEGDTALHYRVMDGDVPVGELHMRDLVKALVPRISSTA